MNVHRTTYRKDVINMPLKQEQKPSQNDYLHVSTWGKKIGIKMPVHRPVVEGTQLYQPMTEQLF